MKPFTVWSDSAIDLHIQRMLDRVVAAVTAQMGSDLAAIVLAGGFGRGEGGVLRRPDGSLHVVNDFDLEVVYREPLGRLLSMLKVHFTHRRRLAALAERLADELDMKQVDLSLRGAHSLGKSQRRLADFDLRHGHRLLWGASDPCDVMPSFESVDIPAFEGTWLLRNRGIGLVLARLYLDLPHGLRPEHRENFCIEVNKAALAMGDALWILSGRYEVSYAARKARFGELAVMGCPDFDCLWPIYDQAAEFKLRPVEPQYAAEEPKALWSRIAQHHIKFFLWFESQRLGLPMSGLTQWHGWAQAQARDTRGGALRRLVDRHLGASGNCPRLMAPLRQDRLASIACVMALLAARLNPADEGRQILSCWLDDDAPAGLEASWRHVARGLLAALHPGGEVGRLLATSQSAA